MKRVLFLTNYPSPYRVRFFDELGKHMDVTVLFSDRAELKKHRSASWYVEGEGNFRRVQLTKRLATIGSSDLCRDVIEWLRKPFDAIVLCGYATPTAMLAITYMRLHKIPFWMEVDGGLIREESRLKYRFKRTMVSSASRWLSTGRDTTRFLVHYGAKEENVHVYPFTSLQEADLLSEPVSQERKAALRQELGMEEDHVVLSIGQFIHRKGFDVLLKAAVELGGDTGIYIVGGEPTEEYLKLRDDLKLENVHFVGFQKKEILAKFYQAADVFALPTREDIWGLVINEAMAYGLPVVTTDKCVAGQELVENGVNGYLVPVDDHEALAQRLNTILTGDLLSMGQASLEKVRPYTIENMAKVHVEIFDRQE